MDTTPEKQGRVEALLEGALARPPEERQRYLTESCNDETLRAEVTRRLADLLQSLTVPADEPASTDSTVLAKQLESGSLPAGKILAGRFKLLQFLAKGGMGEVYEAEDLELQGHVAVKMVRPELLRDARAVQRFRREVQLAKRVTHPNVCRIFDLFRHRGADEGSDSPQDAILVSMELLRGETLAQIMKRRGRLTPKDALPVVQQIAAGLSAAHQAGIVHRDFKPGNVMLVPGGELCSSRAVVTDFGLALGFGEDASMATALTTAGAVVGTPAYMAPEQILGSEVTSATDIYALGLVIHEMVTGALPFSSEKQPPQTLRRVQEAVPSPGSVEPTLDQAWESTILRCLEREPANRFRSVEEVVRALEQPTKNDATVQGLKGSELQADLPSQKERIDLADHAAQTRKSEQRYARKSAQSRWTIAGTTLTIALAAGGWLFLPRKAHALTDKDTVVLGDFTNSTGDAVFDNTLRQGLAVQLEESPFLSLLSEQRVQQTLRLMDQPADAKLTANIARELCERAGSKAYLSGSIANLGNQYVLGIKAVNCVTGATLAEVQERASGKEQVLSAMDRATPKLRSQLGESLGAVRQFATPLEQATTPSLEALQVYSLGREKMISSSDFEAAATLFQRAIELDPNCAMAYLSLGLTELNLGETDLAVVHIRKAYNLREHVSQWEKFAIEARYEYAVSSDLLKAKQIYESWAQVYPRDWIPVGALLTIDDQLALFDTALAEARQEVALNPSDISPYLDLLAGYVNLNRLGEAKNTAEGIEKRNPGSFYLRLSLYQLAFLQNDSAAMAQQVAWSSGKPGIEDVFLANEADTAAYFGRLQKAREISRDAVSSASMAGKRETAANYQAKAAQREALFGNTASVRQLTAAALKLSTDRDVQFNTALALALAGDAALAATLADDLNHRFPEDTIVQLNYLPAIRAQLLLSYNDPSKAMESLQPAARYELGALDNSLAPVYIRGKVYLALHQGREAATEFQKILDHGGIVVNEPIAALARLGLARACAADGKTAEAHTAYNDFLTLWKDADPDIPILIAAKAEYAKLK